MASYNRVILIGNLTRDIELQYTPSGVATARLGVATNRRWTDKNSGEVKEEVTFVDCQIWGKSAQSAAQYLQKGAPVHIEGRLKLESWQDKATGAKRSKLLVVIERLNFLNQAPARNDQAAPTPQQRPAAAAPAKGVAGIPQNRYPPQQSAGMAAENARHAAATQDAEEMPGEIQEENIPF